MIPHRHFAVNIFVKSRCPILTAAEGIILGVKMFAKEGAVIVCVLMKSTAGLNMVGIFSVFRRGDTQFLFE